MRPIKDIMEEADIMGLTGAEKTTWVSNQMKEERDRDEEREG